MWPRSILFTNKGGSNHATGFNCCHQNTKIKVIATKLLHPPSIISRCTARQCRTKKLNKRKRTICCEPERNLQPLAPRRTDRRQIPPRSCPSRMALAIFINDTRGQLRVLTPCQRPGEEEFITLIGPTLSWMTVCGLLATWPSHVAATQSASHVNYKILRTKKTHHIRLPMLEQLGPLIKCCQENWEDHDIRSDVSQIRDFLHRHCMSSTIRLPSSVIPLTVPCRTIQSVCLIRNMTTSHTYTAKSRA